MTKEKNNKLYTVAIVGRPNVGKSSLFNSIIGRRISVVHEEIGITRDNIIATKEYRDREFQLIDTGGLFPGDPNTNSKSLYFNDKIFEQVHLAIDTADILIFVTDIKGGVNPLDKQIAQILRSSGKRVFIAVNKVDNTELEDCTAEFLSLGFSELISVSCIHRKGITTLLDSITEEIPQDSKSETEEAFSLGIVGRPNVGKSSLINKILGNERVIVSNKAGTTRDSVEIPFRLSTDQDDKFIKLVDTPGLRKRAKANSEVEYFSILRTERTIKQSDIVLLVIEADNLRATSLDEHIANLITQYGKGCIIVANKWDACSGHKQKHVRKYIRRTLPFLNYAPIVFTCAISGYNFKNLYKELFKIHEQQNLNIPTSAINKVIKDAMEKNTPPCIKSKSFKVFYGTMVKNKPPVFMLFVNNPKLCPSNYRKYLQNYIRQAFNFYGFPVHIKLKQRN